MHFKCGIWKIFWVMVFHLDINLKNRLKMLAIVNARKLEATKDPVDWISIWYTHTHKCHFWGIWSWETSIMVNCIDWLIPSNYFLFVILLNIHFFLLRCWYIYNFYVFWKCSFWNRRKNRRNRIEKGGNDSDGIKEMCIFLICGRWTCHY